MALSELERGPTVGRRGCQWWGRLGRVEFMPYVGGLVFVCQYKLGVSAQAPVTLSGESFVLGLRGNAWARRLGSAGRAGTAAFVGVEERCTEVRSSPPSQAGQDAGVSLLVYVARL